MVWDNRLDWRITNTVQLRSWEQNFDISGSGSVTSNDNDENLITWKQLYFFLSYTYNMSAPNRKVTNLIFVSPFTFPTRTRVSFNPDQVKNAALTARLTESGITSWEGSTPTTTRWRPHPAWREHPTSGPAWLSVLRQRLDTSQAVTLFWG